jgi:signal transduction histidine kinase
MCVSSEIRPDQPGKGNLLPGFFRTLKFQIAAALLALVSVFAVTTGFTYFSFQEQGSSHAVLFLAGKLQVTARHLASQAMNYEQNAPRDYPTYYRDLRLYYQDLMRDMGMFQRIADAFMKEDFGPAVTGLPDAVFHRLHPKTRAAVRKVETVWEKFRRELMEALGTDPENPRLEYAAEYIIAHQNTLDRATGEMLDTLREQIHVRLQRLNRVNQLALVVTVAIALGFAYWFYRKVLVPLDTALTGFRRVSQGEFGHRVRVRSNNELRWLAEGLNLLSSRLNGIFGLIGRLQQGSNLDQTLEFVAEEFAGLLPLDWVGVLFVIGNRSSIKLDRSYTEGQVEVAVRSHFSLPGTLLEQALHQESPLHVPDVPGTAAANPHYRFLAVLAERGLNDAIFLPVTGQSPVPGVLVVASRRAGAYTAEHLELLSNIAHLVSHSFGRTVRLAEQARLATIGEFASGIAHEIRNPLSTIMLALDHFKKLDLPGSAAKRAELASREAERMASLLEDMLLYAKPLELELRPLDLAQLVAEFIDSDQRPERKPAQRFRFTTDGSQARILGDPDRLTQILLNLARNACDAAPPDGAIDWSVTQNLATGSVALEVQNGGDPIPEELLDRITDPFVTTKSSGTGLGLSIVKRLATAQGGDLHVESGPGRGTRIRITFPAAAR